jgi:hypothetical protein
MDRSSLYANPAGVAQPIGNQHRQAARSTADQRIAAKHTQPQMSGQADPVLGEKGHLLFLTSAFRSNHILFIQFKPKDCLSDMEVVGVLCAIPALIELIQKTAILVKACASRSSLAKVTKGIDIQLQILGDILSRIEKRWKDRAIPSDQLKDLGPLARELREELSALEKLLTRANAPRAGQHALIRRVKLVVGGFEKEVKSHVQRIENIKTLLALKLADGIHAAVSGR